MITRVQVKNYRSIEDADVQMEPMTVLVGRNGSGKSSFVDAIKFVRDALRIGIENAITDRNGFSSIRRWSPGRKHQVKIVLTIDQGDFYGNYEITLSSDGEGFKILREKASYRNKMRIRFLGGPKNNILPDFDGSEAEYDDEDKFERHGKNWVTLPKSLQNDSKNIKYLFNQPLEATALALPTLSLFGGFNHLQQYLTGDFYTIFPNTLRIPQKPMAERVLNDHGDNFVSVLQHITRDKVQKSEIVSVLSRVVEGVCDIRVRPVGSFLVAELQHQDLAQENGESGPWFDLSQESDGTLRMLGLLAALYQSSDESSLLALEEPEIALHPGALAILADELLAASRRRPILVTTQSPDLIARFPAANLRVVERVEGVTKISPLEETQRRIIEDQLFNAGGLMRIEGLRGTASVQA